MSVCVPVRLAGVTAGNKPATSVVPANAARERLSTDKDAFVVQPLLRQETWRAESHSGRKRDNGITLLVCGRCVPNSMLQLSIRRSRGTYCLEEVQQAPETRTPSSNSHHLWQRLCSFPVSSAQKGLHMNEITVYFTNLSSRFEPVQTSFRRFSTSSNRELNRRTSVQELD